MAAELVHSPTPEEIMEYLDGEGTPAQRAGIEAHLAACPSCQGVATDQRSQSRLLTEWRVAPAPETLHAPAGARRSVVATLTRWRPSRVVMAALSAAAIVLLVVSYKARTTQRATFSAEAQQTLDRPAVDFVKARGSDGGSTASTALTVDPGATSGLRDRTAADAVAGQARGDQNQVSHGPSVIRTATLQIVAKDFSHVRGAVELILDSNGGFADQLSLSADPGSVRVLHGTLRVPGPRLTDVLARLRALGQVTQDQQNAQDVSDQLVDLDARLRNARATEQRLSDLLKNRTGKLTDVLEVEQEITRVRLDIERLDAEKTNMTRRVAYATIDLTIGEERKALAPGLPLLTQIRIAAAEGLQHVFDTLVGITLFVLRAGPSLILWAFAGIAAWITIKRIRKPRAA